MRDEPRSGATNARSDGNIGKTGEILRVLLRNTLQDFEQVEESWEIRGLAPCGS